MQKLSLGNYVNFLGNLLHSTQEKKIDLQLFERALISGFEWNTMLQENYQSKDDGSCIEGEVDQTRQFECMYNTIYPYQHFRWLRHMLAFKVRHHVKLQAHVYKDTNELHVMKVTMMNQKAGKKAKAASNPS